MVCARQLLSMLPVLIPLQPGFQFVRWVMTSCSCVVRFVPTLVTLHFGGGEFESRFVSTNGWQDVSQLC